MKLLAIDPGPKESALLAYDLDTGIPNWWTKAPNAEILDLIPRTPAGYCGRLAIETVASYGMSVGADVFTTCEWQGRFIERWNSHGLPEPRRVKRLEVKMAVCHNSRANDSNIRQALIDMYGGKDRAIGRKASPGPLYGLSKDGWAALGVAITAAADLRDAREAA